TIPSRNRFFGYSVSTLVVASLLHAACGSNGSGGGAATGGAAGDASTGGDNSGTGATSGSGGSMSTGGSSTEGMGGEGGAAGSGGNVGGRTDVITVRSNVEGGNHIWRMDVDGEGRVHLTTEIINGNPRRSPDGTQIT